MGVEALEAEGQAATVELCLDWLLNHPVTEKQTRSFLIHDLGELGFSPQQAAEALDVKGLHLEAATAYLAEAAADAEESHLEAASEADDEKHVAAVEPRLDVVQEEPTVSAERVAFGSLVRLRNIKTGQWLLKGEQDAGLLASSTADEEASFVVALSGDVRCEEDLVLRANTGARIGLQDVEGCWVGTEIDGTVHCKRRGPLGLFSSWRLTLLDAAGEQERTVVDGDIVVLESNLHLLLHTTADGGVESSLPRSPQPPPEAQWTVELLKKFAGRFREDNVVEQVPQKRVPKPGFELWSILRRHFRLAVLRIRSGQVQFLLHHVAQQRKKLTVEPDEAECVVCWDGPRNTVILDCGHLCVCSGCAPDVMDAEAPECPVCRKRIARIVTVNED